MIKIDLDKYPKQEEFEVYYPNGELIVKSDDILLLHYIRTQIKENDIKGCYIIFKNEKITIDREGNLSHYPKGFDEVISDIFLKLV